MQRPCAGSASHCLQFGEGDFALTPGGDDSRIVHRSEHPVEKLRSGNWGQFGKSRSDLTSCLPQTGDAKPARLLIQQQRLQEVDSLLLVLASKDIEVGQGKGKQIESHGLSAVR